MRIIVEFAPSLSLSQVEKDMLRPVDIPFYHRNLAEIEARKKREEEVSKRSVSSDFRIYICVMAWTTDTGSLILYYVLFCSFCSCSTKCGALLPRVNFVG